LDAKTEKDSVLEVKNYMQPLPFMPFCLILLFLYSLPVLLSFGLV